MTTTAQTPRAYLFTGEDEFHKQKELESLLATLIAQDFADFDLEKMDGDAATAERILSAVLIPPLGSKRRVALVRYANKMNPGEQQKLAEQMRSIPSTGCIILVIPAVENKEAKPRRGSGLVPELTKAVRALGEVRDFRPSKGRTKSADAQKLAQSIFAAAGKSIEPTALAAFVERTAEDLTILRSEAEKLVTYCWDKQRISRADVDAVTAETPEEKVFRLVDAVARKQQGEALRLLEEVFLAGDKPDATAPRTLALIARQFRLLWQMRILRDEGVREPRKDQVPEHLHKILPSEPNLPDLVSRQPWMAGKLASQADRFDTSDLRRCFLAVARADRMLKGIEGSIDDPQKVMEILVMELARR